MLNKIKIKLRKLRAKKHFKLFFIGGCVVFIALVVFGVVLATSKPHAPAPKQTTPVVTESKPDKTVDLSEQTEKLANDDLEDTKTTKEDLQAIDTLLH